MLVRRLSTPLAAWLVPVAEPEGHVCGGFVRGLALRKVDVRAYEDQSHPEGGHAVIVVTEIDGLPEGTSFLLKSPDDAPGAEPLEGWPRGHQLPIEVRNTSDGAELVIGPTITDSQLLLPGTAVRIEIPSAEVWGEFVWPNVSPTRRPRRRNLIVNRTTTRSSRAGVMLPPEADAPADIEDEAEWHDEPAVEEAPRVTPGRAQYAPADASVAQPAEAHFAATPPRPEPEPRPATRAEAAPAEEEVVVFEEDRVSAATAGRAQSYADASGYAADAARARFSGGGRDDHEADPAYAAEATLSRLLQHEAASRPRIAAQSAAGSEIPPSGRYGGRSQTSYSPESSSRGWSRRAMEPEFQSANAGRSVTGKALLGGGLAAALVALATLAVFAPDRLPGLRGGPKPVAAVGAPSGETAAADEDTPDSVFEALAVANVSPRGVAADMPLGRVLDLANKNAMTSGSQADREEGAFWRKRYVVGALGSDRTKKALTQLGSLYAEPTGSSPDFAKARLLWEVASAAGDPVAMCFLGQLYESGLSVAADKKSALQWYERAKQAGGCPAVDESIARVRQ